MAEDLSLEDRIAAARIVYEGTHGLTMSDLAEQSNIPLRILKNSSRDQGWRKKLETKHGGATEDAKSASEIVSAGAEASTAVLERPSKEAEVISNPVPSEREALLARHRSEWAVPRAMSAEAVRQRDTNPALAFERAKMAKITAETLKIVQEGERKAHSIDNDVGSLVVIDRG